jgi:hypothetical protein
MEIAKRILDRLDEIVGLVRSSDTPSAFLELGKLRAEVAALLVDGREDDDKARPGEDREICRFGRYSIPKDEIQAMYRTPCVGIMLKSGEMVLLQWDDAVAAKKYLERRQLEEANGNLNNLKMIHEEVGRFASEISRGLARPASPRTPEPSLSGPSRPGG